MGRNTNGIQSEGLPKENRKEIAKTTCVGLSRLCSPPLLPSRCIPPQGSLSQWAGGQHKLGSLHGWGFTKTSQKSNAPALTLLKQAHNSFTVPTLPGLPTPTTAISLNPCIIIPIPQMSTWIKSD